MVPVQQAAIDITGVQDEDDAWDQLYQTLLVVIEFHKDETYPPMDPDKLMRLWNRSGGMPEFLIPRLKSEYVRWKASMAKLAEEDGSQESDTLRRRTIGCPYLRLFFCSSINFIVRFRPEGP
jgi:hypothetical protein